MNLITQKLVEQYLEDDKTNYWLDKFSTSTDEEYTCQKWLRESAAKRYIFNIMYGDLLEDIEGQRVLDVGGGANEDQVNTAFSIILDDPAVKGILVNIFGGIMRCDIIARGVIGATQALDLDVPLVVRLVGTNFEEGRKILSESDLNIHTAETLAEGAQKIVSLIGGGK